MGIPCRLAKSAGYRRSWCLHREEHGGFTLPALREDRDNACTVNGVAYPAPSWWLKRTTLVADTSGAALDDDAFRGAGLKRVKLDPKLITALHSWMVIPDGAQVFSYAASAPISADYDHPIRQ